MIGQTPISPNDKSTQINAFEHTALKVPQTEELTHAVTEPRPPGDVFVAEASVGPAGLLGGEMQRLLLHSSHYLAGLVGGLVAGLISFPIFTRAFSVAEYGLIDLAQKVVLLLVIASKVGLPNAILRFYDKDQFASDFGAARKYYSTMFLGTLGTSLIVAGAAYFLAISRLGSLTASPLGALLFLLPALGLLRAVGATLWAFLRIEERTKLFNATTVGCKLATVAVICMLLPWAGRTASTYLAGVILVETAVVGSLTWSLLRRGVLDPKRFDAPLYRAGVLFGMPLVVYEFSFAILASADRFLVRHYLGADALGFYSAAYGLAQHGNELLSAPLTLAIIPIYMSIWTSDGAEKTGRFLTLTFDLFLIGAIGVLVSMIAAARPLVVLLASSKYAGVDRLIPVFVAGLLIYSMHVFVGAGLLIHKRTLLMAAAMLVSAGLNIALNCLLLPRMGLLGGALATVVSYLFCILWLAYASNRVLPLHIQPSSILKYLLAGTVAALAGSRVTFAPHIVELIGKSGTALSVYALALYILDSRVRRCASWALQRAKTAI